MDDACLIIRVGGQLCALPLAHVAETMRPQAVRPVTGAPRGVSGIAIIRGSPVAVVEAAALMPGGGTTATRFVLLKTADRHVALAVDDVVGIRRIDRDRFAELPPLLGGANQDVVSAVATLDGELVLLMRAGKLVPPDAWALMERRAGF